MGANIIDYVASFVILLGLLTFTITTATGTLDNLYIYHSSQQLNSMAANFLNDLLGGVGSPSNWAQSTVDPTSIGFAWAIGEGNYINPFVPMRLMDANVEQRYGLDVYNDLSSGTLSSWPGVNLYFNTEDGVSYEEASRLLNTEGSYGWRATYTPAYQIEMATSNPDVIPWYTGWGYRMALTINHTKVPTTMTNYPLLISLIQPTLDLNARTDGADILFTSSDKLTKIPHELDYYNSETGKVRAWIKIPLLSSTADTIIYMYYGNPTAFNQGAPSSVWAGYYSVYHMEDVPDQSHTKDSSTGLIGSKAGHYEPAEILDGVVSYAQNFDGSNDYITLNQATLSGGNEVFEMWLKSVKSSMPQAILSSGFKNNTVGFIDISRLPQTETSAGNDLMIDYAANSVWVQKAASVGIDLTCVHYFKSKLYAGASDGRFYVWDEIGSWVPMPSLPLPEKFASLAVYHNKLYAGTNGGAKLYEWDEGYLAWVLKAPKLRLMSLLHNTADGKIYGGTDDGRLLRWNTTLVRWDVVAPALGSETSINSLTMYNSALYGGTSPGGNLYRWNNTGAGSWVLVASPPISNPFTDVTTLNSFNGKIYGGSNPGGYLISWSSGSSWVIEKTTGESSLTAITVRGSNSTTNYSFTNNVGSWINAAQAATSDNLYSSHLPTSTTTTRSPSANSGPWTNPTRAYADDTNRATRSANNDAGQIYYNYGYAIPAGAIITSVRIRVDAYVTSNDELRLSISKDGGSSFTTVTGDISPGTSAPGNTYWKDVTSVFAWTPANINGNQIRVKVAQIIDGSRDTVYLDWIPVEVTYLTVATHDFYSFIMSPLPTITKVEVGVEGYTVGDERLSVQVSWDGGTSWSSSQLMNLPTSDTGSVNYLDFTASTSWNPTKLDNSNFRIRIVDVVQGTTADTVYVDQIFTKISSSDSELFASTSPRTYLWRLTPSGTWTNIINTQYASESSITSIVTLAGTLYGSTYPSGTLIKQGTGGSSNTWVLAAAAPAPQIITTIITDGTDIYGGSSPSGLLYKSNGGAWSSVVTNQYGGETAILSLAFNPSGTRVEAGTDISGLLLSAPKVAVGGSWTKDADINIAGGETEIRSMTVYNDKLYLGTSNHGLLYEWNGLNAFVQKAPQFPGQTRINSMAVLGVSLYGGTSSGSLLKWTTGDTAWSQVAAPFGTETSVNSIVIYNNKIYGSTSPGGRLLEWNGAGAWVGKTYILGSETSISSLAVYNGKLYGGTAPNGLLYEWDGATKWVKMANSLYSQGDIPALTVFNNGLYGVTSSNGYLFKCSDTGSRIYPGFFTGYENKWMHVTMQVDYVQKRIDFYQNGTLLPTYLNATNIVSPTTTPKYIGAYVVSGAAYNTYIGGIDELRISQTARDSNWINLSYNNQASPVSFTKVSPEESIFFKVIIKVTGKDGPINNATCRGTLVYSIPGVANPSYGQLSSQPTTTDVNGEARVEFRGYTSDTPVYVVFMRAEHAGVSGVDYYVNTPSPSTAPLGVFVTDYSNGELTIAHKKDFSASYPGNDPVGYNATFVMPIGTYSYSPIILGSAGQISPGSPGYVQLGETKENTGVILAFYKTVDNTYGVTYTPWGVSALGLESTFGAPIKDATNVITKTRVVNIGPFTYNVKVELWSLSR